MSYALDLTGILLVIGAALCLIVGLSDGDLALIGGGFSALASSLLFFGLAKALHYLRAIRTTQLEESETVVEA